jgi:antitoxin component YwqK of YwqJK toxin-antitoxin module
MKHVFAILFLALGTSLSAQELLGQEFWPDGSLRATRYAEGRRVHFITYHENGKVKEVGCFRNGRRDGTWKQFTDQGTLLAHAGFKNGERQGVWEFRSEADKPMGELTYHDGVLQYGKQFDAEGLLATHRAY